MKPFFVEIFEYSHHFNQQLLKDLQPLASNLSERSIQLFSHILNAHQIWNNRVLHKEAELGVWEVHAWENALIIDAKNHQHTLKILDHMELDTIIHYSNSKGQHFSNSVKDILFHVVNHSTHHRGQIVADIRKIGGTPMVSDYIFYKR
ncbi:MAG: DinB family protein [Bacteroidota bacterium]